MLSARGARRALVPLLALVLVLVAAPRAWAEQDGHGPSGAAVEAGHDEHPKGNLLPSMKEGLASGILALVVFGVVFAVLYVKGWPRILKGLDDRAQKIRSEIASAEAARKQAKEALAQYEKSLAEARAEAQQMLEATKGQQQQLAAELRAKAETELNAMRDRARRDIESARRQALAEIYAQASALATGVASKILEREVNADDQQRLIDESIRALESSKA